MDLTAANRFALAFHYRHDEHTETQTSRPGLAASVPEPIQTSIERNWSIAAEDRFAFSPELALTIGASYEWRDLDRAEEFGVPPGGTGALRIFSFPLRNVDALNAQGRIDWTPGDGKELHVSVSSRARFPTLFERFSSQFGTAEPNPELKAERATNVEFGGSRQLGPVRIGGAVFYSWLTDALVSVRTPTNLNRRENYGSADYYGAELSIDADLSPTLQAGLNYSYIHRSFDVGTPPAGALIRPFRLTDVPRPQGFCLYLVEAHGWLGDRAQRRVRVRSHDRHPGIGERARAGLLRHRELCDRGPAHRLCDPA
ncbi:MAG: TonB-dependent receptor [Sphingomonas sp.]